MSRRPHLPVRPQRTSAGLLPEPGDTLVERATATVHPARAARGRVFRFELSGLKPQAEAGPVDLTIYAPRAGAAPARQGRSPNPESYMVLVEATLEVKGTRRRGGRARFAFRSVRSDLPGVYLAVFRRTDISSRPVAISRFTITR